MSHGAPPRRGGAGAVEGGSPTVKLEYVKLEYLNDDEEFDDALASMPIPGETLPGQQAVATVGEPTAPGARDSSAALATSKVPPSSESSAVLPAPPSASASHGGGSESGSSGSGGPASSRRTDLMHVADLELDIYFKQDDSQQHVLQHVHSVVQLLRDAAAWRPTPPAPEATSCSRALLLRAEDQPIYMLVSPSITQHDVEVEVMPLRGTKVVIVRPGADNVLALFHVFFYCATADAAVALDARTGQALSQRCGQWLTFTAALAPREGLSLMVRPTTVSLSLCPCLPMDL